MSLITYLTRTHFAARVLEDALPEELRRLGIKRPLVLSDAAGAAPDVRGRLEDALPGESDVHWEVLGPDPSDLNGLRATCDGCDAVIALGGHLALDVARLLAAPAGAKRARLVIAIPTTTASVGLGPVWAELARPGGRQPAVPDVILCDPTLTIWAGAQLTAAAGLDALTHCVEAYLGTAYNPPADGIALEGVRRVAAHLERAVADGRDLEARREMLAAALNAGLALQKGTGGLDAAARALEREAGLSAPHGIFHAALLPQILSFNAPAVADRFAALRQALGLGTRADLPAALADLGGRVGLPRRLSVLGLGRTELRRAARAAAEDPGNGTNPRLATEADYLEIFGAAL